MEKTGQILFKYRSYTPLPFLAVMILFINPAPVFLISGLLITAAGESIRLWAVSYAGSETRTTITAGGTSLVTQGPYSFIRNPLYFGNLLIYTGIGIMSNSLFPYLQIIALIFFHFQYHVIILVEETYFMKEFPERYSLYSKYVNKFIPYFKSIPNSIKSNLKFDIRDGLKSEARSLQASISTIIIILFFYFTGIKLLTC